MDEIEAPTPVLEVRDVSKRFLGVVALDQVSLSLGPGEVHALVGENGAGKSTLIKVMTGVYQPDEGETIYLGQPVSYTRPRDAQAAGISTIYQEVNLVPLLSVARNLFLGREPKSRLGLIDTARMHRQAAELLAGYGISVDVRRPLGELGLGIQQMVAITRAVSTAARVVIMDEPTSSLEPREVERLFEVVNLLRARQVAVLYITHKLDEVFKLCQRVTVLRDGRLVHTGDVTAITRLRLVAAMLGRDVAEVQAHGVTSFGEEHQRRDDSPVLEAHGLTRRHVLDGVSIGVRRGEVVGLAGLLGSGRTETAKAIFGAQPLDQGSVNVAGRPLRLGSPQAAIGAGIAMLPEDRKAEGIVPNLSVRENIVLAALPALTRAGFLSERRQDELVTAFIGRLRIKTSSPDQPVAELSGGNQQKVLLARMLCLHPTVLILDEPTRGIDVGAKAEVQSLIDELASEGLGVVLVSSDAEELIEGADRVVVLRDGVVVGILTDARVTTEALLETIATAAPEDKDGDH